MTKITEQPLVSKNQTGIEMYRLINNYSNDINGTVVNDGLNNVQLSNLPLDQFYNSIRSIPYRRDNRPVEVVARPAVSLNNFEVGIDCKKKSIILSSYLKNRGIPYRLVASSRRPDGRIHHVFPQIKFGSSYYNFDATMDHNEPFEQKLVTAHEVLNDGNNTVDMGFDPLTITGILSAGSKLLSPLKNIFGTQSESEKTIQLMQKQAELSAAQQKKIMMIAIPAAVLLMVMIMSDGEKGKNGIR